MYRRTTWSNTKSQLQHYRRRKPERSALYQLVYHFRDELPRAWESHFQETYGVLRDEVLDIFDEYLNCGLLCHGAARVYCDACKHSLLVAFSCKKRGVCPSCSAKRAVKFAEHLYAEILEPVPNRHIIFTIPKRLRSYFRYDRSLNTVLFKAAWGSVKEVLGTTTSIPAVVLTVQTAGEAVLADLSKRELVTDNDVAQILSQTHTGFNVWVGESFQAEASEKFVARYIERGPISLEKLSIQDDIVSYTTKDGRAHEFDGLEFLALLTSHVPKPYESITRYYGYYSSRSRGERRKRERYITAASLPEPSKKATPTWASCMKRILEIDPLECPKCKSQMRIIAFITDSNEISKIMRSLNIPEFKTPAKLPRAPPRADTEWSDYY